MDVPKFAKRTVMASRRRGGTSVAVPKRVAVARHSVIARWEPTPGAHCECLPCRAHARPRPGPASRDVLTQLRELDPDVVVIAGDADEALVALAREAAAGGLRVAVAPRAAVGVTVPFAHRLASGGVGGIVLELDDAAAPHAIAAARGAGLGLELVTRLARGTIRTLPTTAACVAALRPELWNVAFPVGPELGPDACERVFHFLAAWSEETGVPVTTTDAPAYRRVVLQRGGKAPPRAVNDGNGLVVVAHEGDVHPGSSLRLTTANVRETRLADVYRTSRLFRALRDASRLEGKCGRCPYRRICGGSRARAYAATGSIHAADPACAHLPLGPSGEGTR
jgi:AdoMet-dependent heme synthase